MYTSKAERSLRPRHPQRTEYIIDNISLQYRILVHGGDERVGLIPHRFPAVQIGQAATADNFDVHASQRTGSGLDPIGGGLVRLGSQFVLGQEGGLGRRTTRVRTGFDAELRPSVRALAGSGDGVLEGGKEAGETHVGLLLLGHQSRRMKEIETPGPIGGVVVVVEIAEGGMMLGRGRGVVGGGGGGIIGADHRVGGVVAALEPTEEGQVVPRGEAEAEGELGTVLARTFGIGGAVAVVVVVAVGGGGVVVPAGEQLR
mmetsp:Transcript_47304/g.143252  ORF Transcript_47304/g.143252 Transcript_47304/m.143252 type:complete len:258 (-) Transcript_47304:384-1157(-)